MNNKLSQGLIEFIEKSPSCYHTVAAAADMLKESGFREIYESEAWKLNAGGKYFITRNMSSLIAFKLPRRGFSSFQIVAAHGDSPSFKLKPEPEIEQGGYVKLNTERYGGMIAPSWLDRPLSAAGRVVIKSERGIEARTVNIDRDLCIIPNLAIHMNGKINSGYEYNAQKDMLALYCLKDRKKSLGSIIAEYAGCNESDISGSDLFLYNREKGRIWGADGEFISAPRLDDLQCAYAALCALIDAECTDAVSMLCIFDNEEVGSGTKQGARSSFLPIVSDRIREEFNKTAADLSAALSSSFMLSADNAHALHPNHADKSDPVNRPVIGGGVVIKHSANQKYTTDSVSDALVKMECEIAGVPYQSFVNRSDMPGGSTLGNLAVERTSVIAADIGAPQLAMHSAFETAGTYDTHCLKELLKKHFEIKVTAVGHGKYIFE